MELDRRQHLPVVRTLVVKLGSQLLTAPDGQLDARYLSAIAAQVVSLGERKVRVAIVSSGAISAGVCELNLPGRPTDLAKLQAVAAVGQRKLMDGWAEAFKPFNIPVAQVLLTREDIDSRSRFLNLRNTIHAAHELNAIPIINENDTISTDELVRITFGDNDILASMVASALRADLLVLLSVVDGIMDASGKSVRLIENPDQAQQLVRVEKSALGKGGMNSKLEAARMVTSAGEAMVVADGRMENVLPRILDAHDIGTLFVPAGQKRSSRSRWIGSVRTLGTIVVDDGAAAALCEKNKSLLAAGIVKVQGTFARGDACTIATKDGRIIARGLSNYASDDVEKIRGKKTAEVRAMLAERAYDEVVHRDNLVIT